ncbi:MAG: YHS domain-containing protein [Melioribacteraceae bacterium]
MFRKRSFTLLFLLILSASVLKISAQEKPMQMKDSAKTHMKMHKMKGMKEKNIEAASLSDSNIVRKGIIDLMAIDKNKDGKIFQCPMEVNVISDSKGECPECRMNLKEISIQDAKTKLLKRGFKVNESGMNQHPKSDNKNNQASLTTWNKVCPVSGEEVDQETPTVEYKGKVIGFCCSSCVSKFNKEPEKYLKNLSDDGAKFIGKK